MAKKAKVGRPKVSKADKVKRIPISAKVKHHPKIKEQFAAEIAMFEMKLDKELNQ